MSGLTTHVLDTAAGAAAAGLVVALHRLDPDPHKLIEIHLDADGRGRLADRLERGVYELVFAVGDYHRSRGRTHDQPAFLETVPVRFSVNAPAEHYHVPLLVGLFAYSTYRGA